MNNSTMGDVPDISVIRVNMSFQLEKRGMKKMEGMRQQELLIVVSCRPMCLPNAGRCGVEGVTSEQLSAKLPNWQRFKRTLRRFGRSSLRLLSSQYQ